MVYNFRLNFMFLLAGIGITAETAGILRINFQATTFWAFQYHGNVLK